MVKTKKHLCRRQKGNGIDVIRESFVILDSNLRVILANDIFYHTFQVTPSQTEKMFLYELGNSQWNIPILKKLLEEILPQKKVVKDYEVTHTFETIGEKTIQLNAKQIDSMQLIILAMEDITVRKALETQVSKYVKILEVKVSKRIEDLANRVKELETLNKTMVGRELKMVELKKEIEELKKQTKNGNGNHKNGRHK